jgi:hypothetical protein
MHSDDIGVNKFDNDNDNDNQISLLKNNISNKYVNKLNDDNTSSDLFMSNKSDDVFYKVIIKYHHIIYLNM